MKKITYNDLINLWLYPAYGLKIEQVEIKDARDFYEKFPVTKEQYDQWEKEAKELLHKSFRFSKRYIDRAWPMTSLDCAPIVIGEKTDNVKK